MSAVTDEQLVQLLKASWDGVLDPGEALRIEVGRIVAACEIAAGVQALRAAADHMQHHGQYEPASELRARAAAIEAGQPIVSPRVRVSSTGSWLPERNGDES